jgi:hypothetical protein
LIEGWYGAAQQQGEQLGGGELSRQPRICWRVPVMLAVFWGLTLLNFFGENWILRVNKPAVIIGTLIDGDLRDGSVADRARVASSIPRSTARGSAG